MVNPERARTIALILSKLSPDDILMFEERDPQFKVIKKLCTVIRDLRLMLILVTMNSLVSYMLTGRGEDHWAYFSEYFSRNRLGEPCRDFERYIVNSPYLARGRDAKLGRVRKFCRGKVISQLGSINDLGRLWGMLADDMGSSPNSKTIVFAVKMMYYVYRACGVPVKLPDKLPIPVDYRISTLTYCSGIVDEKPEVLLRRQEMAQEAWDLVSKLSGIPAINLDAVLWVLGGALIYSNFNVDAALNRAIAYDVISRDKAEVFKDLLNELSVRCGRG